MSNLGPQQQNVSYDGLLQVDGGISSTLKPVQDGMGNMAGLWLSSTGTNALTATDFVASVNGTPITGALPRPISDGFGDYVSVKDFGAVGDGVTDDSSTIQSAIDYVSGNGGGVLYVPRGTYKCNVILKQGVILTAYAGGQYGYASSAGAEFIQNSSGFVVDTPSTGISNCAVLGINFLGAGASISGGGVRFRNVTWGSIRGCFFNNFSDQAILKQAGNANVFEDILTINVLLNRTRTQQSGCVEISGGADDFLNRIEANPSLTAISNANRYIAAILISSSGNSFISNCVAEFADWGFYFINSDYLRVINCRADTNFGSGFQLAGNGQYTNCTSLNNGTSATNTYDGFFADTGSLGNTLVNCLSVNTSGSVKYGFNDQVNVSSVSARNQYIGCKATGYGTAPFLMQGYLGSSAIEAGIPVFDGTATPNTAGTTFILLSQSTPTTVTNFLNGYDGKTIRLLGNTNVTIKNGTYIWTNTNADKLLELHKIYTFTYYNGTWLENA